MVHAETACPPPLRFGLATAIAAALLMAACSAGSSSRAEASTGPGQATSPEWLTYHHDFQRTGRDSASARFGTPSRSWTSPALDGPVYAEPLIDGAAILVATEAGSIYRLDAATGVIRWRTHVDDAAPLSTLPCGDIDPLGITGTPVIDPATQTLFAVSERRDHSHELVAVAVADGSLRWRRTIDPAGTVPENQQQRAALTLVAGRVVVAMGGLYGDCGQYRGYVVSVAAGGAGSMATYVLPARNRGGIWASSGPAVDAGGRILVATGNSETGADFDHSNSVIALDSALHDTDFFSPANWRQLSDQDVDLGSTGPTVIGDSVLEAGKDGILFLLHAGRLGGIGGQAAFLQLSGGVFGGMAADGATLFVPAGGGLDAVAVDAAAASLGLLWRGPPTWPPIVAGGTVWAVEQAGGDLVALDETSGTVRFRLPLGEVEHFTTPAAAHGRLVVAAVDRIVAVSLS